VVEPNADGIAVGAREMFVAVPPWDSPLPKALEPLKDKKGTSGSAWVYSVGH